MTLKLESTLANATGNAGTIDITVDESLEIVNEGSIAAFTLGEGNAGSIHIVTGDSLYLTNLRVQS